MALLETDEILSLIREIGLAPTQGKNLRRMAEQILEAGGEVTDDWEFLESLAGVGHKTASVVMSQAFGHPAFPVDTTSIAWPPDGGCRMVQPLSEPRRSERRCFRKRRGTGAICRSFSLAEYCPARHHDLSECPICSWTATKRRIEDERGR